MLCCGGTDPYHGITCPVFIIAEQEHLNELIAVARANINKPLKPDERALQKGQRST